jgi:hypothetical protein
MLGPELLEFKARIIEICLAQFPRPCGTCGTVYPSFRAWIERTVPVGAPMPDDLEDEDPIGLISFANCPCGSTLSLTCEDPTGAAHRAFNEALRREAAASGRRRGELLTELRETVRAAARAGGTHGPKLEGPAPLKSAPGSADVLPRTQEVDDALHGPTGG